MKSLWYLLLFLLNQCFSLKAQDHNYIKNPAIGVHFILDDFKTADYIQSYSLTDALRNKQFANSKNLKPGLAISYLQGLSNHFDFSVALAGSYLDYTLHNGIRLGQGKLLLEMEALLIGKMFTDKHLISPYLLVGGGASRYNNYYGIFVPLGMGLQVNFSNEVYLLIDAQYRAGITNNVNDHFYYSIGLAGNILKKKRNKRAAKLVLPVTPQSYDRDKDGIPDSVDVCPDVPGLKQFHGCQDSDGDGIPDNEDRCPSVPGILKYHGCPIPDTDGDGINDEDDSCPAVPGLLRYRGCPIPDGDGDGINDEEDKCPTQPGVKQNHGCPLIKKDVIEQINSDAQKIYFGTGSYVLLTQSYEFLDDVIKILHDDPNLKIQIEGHTDSVGSPEINFLLSENRAKAVLDYLHIKGNLNMDRLFAQGFGLSRPVANNKTAQGRSLNRRVELKLTY